MAQGKGIKRSPVHLRRSRLSVMTGNLPASPQLGGISAPFVTNKLGWKLALTNLDRFDNGCLVRRLDEFRALASALTCTAPWRSSAAITVLKHVESVIEATLRKFTRGDQRAFRTARSIAITAISDIEATRHDGLRSHFVETLHHITRDAERLERGLLLSADHFVGLDCVPDLWVENDEEAFMARDAILKAIQAEPRVKRRIALALKYQGFTDLEIGQKVEVSAQRVNVFVRDFAASPLLADFKDGLSARRRQ